MVISLLKFISTFFLGETGKLLMPKLIAEEAGSNLAWSGGRAGKDGTGTSLAVIFTCQPRSVL